MITYQIAFGSCMNSIAEIEQNFTQVELDYLMPLLTKWCTNESEIVNWFNTHKIPACNNKTPDELYKSGETGLLICVIHRHPFYTWML